MIVASLDRVHVTSPKYSYGGSLDVGNLPEPCDRATFSHHQNNLCKDMFSSGVVVCDPHLFLDRKVYRHLKLWLCVRDIVIS